jgi:hypothetical protein
MTTVDPFGVPAAVLQPLPIRFDLQQVIVSTFDSLPTLIMISQTKSAMPSQTSPPATLTSTGEAITDINAELRLPLRDTLQIPILPAPVYCECVPDPNIDFLRLSEPNFTIQTKPTLLC